MTRSTTFIRVFSFLLAALAITPMAGLTLFGQSRTTRSIALTFDDLPCPGVEPVDCLRNAERVSGEILRVLRAHNAPAVAFVNEAKLQAFGERDSRVAILKQWADAGIVLGNHTYSHADFNTVSTEQFEDEIIKGDVITRQLMDPHRPYPLYFRHPQTHTGDTAEKKSAIETFLSARGFTIAPHTIDNSTEVFNVPYAQARRSGDDVTAARLAQAYLDFTFAATGFAEQIAPQIFGRDIPQTLLLHANDIAADYLDETLSRFEERGYRFIRLDEALRDEAYQTHDTLVTRAGPTWLWRWMKSKGMNISFRGDPEVPAWVSDLSSKR